MSKKPKPDTRVTWTEQFTVEFNRGDVPFHLLRVIQDDIAEMKFEDWHWADFGEVQATLTMSRIEQIS